jgi:hypothetical protein
MVWFVALLNYVKRRFWFLRLGVLVLLVAEFLPSSRISIGFYGTLLLGEMLGLLLCLNELAACDLKRSFKH